MAEEVKQYDDNDIVLHDEYDIDDLRDFCHVNLTQSCIDRVKHNNQQFLNGLAKYENGSIILKTLYSPSYLIYSIKEYYSKYNIYCGYSKSYKYICFENGVFNYLENCKKFKQIKIEKCEIEPYYKFIPEQKKYEVDGFNTIITHQNYTCYKFQSDIEQDLKFVKDNLHNNYKLYIFKTKVEYKKCKFEYVQFIIKSTKIEIKSCVYSKMTNDKGKIIKRSYYLFLS